MISERDYEDWICEHLPAVLRHDDAFLIGRQIILQDGTRLDVLAGVPGEDGAVDVVVIEVKAVEATVAHIAQLLGYMGLIHTALLEATDPIHHICNERLRSVRGVLAAPAPVPDAVMRTIGCITELEWCELEVVIRPHLGGGGVGLDPWGTEQNSKLARDLADAAGTAARMMSDPPYASAEDWLEDHADMEGAVPAADDERDLPIATE